MRAEQFVRLIRVPTLAATAVPVMIGGALALSNGPFDVLDWLEILVVALLMQAATNALNEYGDYRHAVDTAPSPGFAGLIVSGEVSSKQILLTAVVCYSLAFLLGVELVLARGAFMLVLGAAAIFAGAVYSEGPIPISSTPFGEVLVAIIMGPIEIVAANLAASGAISNMALVFSVPVSLMVACILLTNNIRDIEKDRTHGRRTLPVLAGRRGSLALLFALMMLTFVWSIPAIVIFSLPISVLLVWIALPLTLWSFSRLAGDSNRWPQSVAIVSRLHLLVGALLTISILLHF